jgi:hypothetical protein
LAPLAAKWAAARGNPAGQEAACATYVNAITTPTVGGNETIDRYRLSLLPTYVAKMKTYGKAVIMYEGGWDRDIKPVSAGGQVSSILPFASGSIDGTSNVISGVNATYAAALQPGYFVVGHGIPPDTIIVSISGASLTLSNQTTQKLPIAQFVVFTPEQMFLVAVKRSQAWVAAMMSYFNQFGSGSGMPADYVQSGLRWGHTFPTAYGLGNTEWGDLGPLWQKEAERNRMLN